MDNNNEKLKVFIDAVNDEIEGEVNRILAAAEERKKAVLAEAESFSAEETGKAVSYSKKDGNLYIRNVSKAELNMKKSVIGHRDELADKVFDAVEKKLAEFRGDQKYVNLLVKNLLLMHVSDGSEIFLSPDDMKYADTLKKAIPSCNAKFSTDEKIRLGGLAVYNAEKGTITDKTFDSAIEEQRRVFTGKNVFAE
ncbi:MAG: hypothetical protein K2N26_01275 [Oscillospiraceae bacterium]|nr:hypothetical protein [Oscillospiraceae bacterium]